MPESAVRLIAFVSFALAALFAGPSAAEKRVALVIGNSDYRHAVKLDTTANDAADMAALLKVYGFTVIEGTLDLDKTGMDRKIREFSEALAGADAGVFFYAGHAFQLNGINYLVPVDAKLENERSVDFETVRLDLIQRTMEREARTNVLFLDACRDNPFVRDLSASMGTRSRSMALGHGLAAAEAGEGTLISYSTQPGNVADDSVGLPNNAISRNSPYTGALVKRLASANEDLASLLTDVRKDVIAVTEKRQIPWEHTSLTDKFWFKGAPAALAGTALPPPLASEAERVWDFLHNSDDIAVLENFRRTYGGANPSYDQLAATRIDELRAAKTKAEEAAREQTERQRRLAMLQKEQTERTSKAAGPKVEDKATYSPQQQSLPAPPIDKSGEGKASPAPIPSLFGRIQPKPTVATGTVTPQGFRIESGKVFLKAEYERAAVTFEQCQEKCRSDPKCKAFQYQHANWLNCYLHSSSSPDTANSEGSVIGRK